MDQPNGQSMPSNETSTTKLTTGYYIAFAGESFILTTAIIYLIMSNFNKKDVKETFANNDKKVIAILSTIILTTALTVGEGMLANKIITNNEPTSNNGNMNNNANANITYSASTEITEDKTITSGTYSSETKDTNALLTSGDITADISNVTVDKTGDSDGGDNTSFYVTNTTAPINLTNNTIINNDESGNFLRVQKDSWGNSGINGGVVTLNMTNQTATGNIVIDSISTLTMNLKEKASFTGSINTKNEAKSITLKLDKTSQIKLTGDSYVTSLEDEDESYSNIDFNGYTLYVNGTALTK